MTSRAVTGSRSHIDGIGARRLWSRYVWREDDRERALSESSRFGDFIAECLESHAPKGSTTRPLAVEIGCGTGEFTVALIERLSRHSTYSWICVDVNHEALNLAKRRLAARGGSNDVKWVQAYVSEHAVPLRRQADLVVVARTLHHVPDLSGFLLRVSEALASQGLVVANVILQEFDRLVTEKKHPRTGQINLALRSTASHLAKRGVLTRLLTELRVLHTDNPSESELWAAIDDAGLIKVRTVQDSNGYLRIALRRKV